MKLFLPERQKSPVVNQLQYLVMHLQVRKSNMQSLLGDKIADTPAMAVTSRLGILILNVDEETNLIVSVRACVHVHMHACVGVCSVSRMWMYIHVFSNVYGRSEVCFDRLPQLFFHVTFRDGVPH